MPASWKKLSGCCHGAACMAASACRKSERWYASQGWLISAEISRRTSSRCGAGRAPLRGAGRGQGRGLVASGGAGTQQGAGDWADIGRQGGMGCSTGWAAWVGGTACVAGDACTNWGREVSSSERRRAAAEEAASGGCSGCLTTAAPGVQTPTARLHPAEAEQLQGRGCSPCRSRQADQCAICSSIRIHQSCPMGPRAAALTCGAASSGTAAASSASSASGPPQRRMVMGRDAWTKHTSNEAGAPGLVAAASYRLTRTAALPSCYQAGKLPASSPDCPAFSGAH